MLLWEALGADLRRMKQEAASDVDVAGPGSRLHLDKRCTAITKAGRRCRGRARAGLHFCPFHDPAVSAEQRRENAAKGGRSRDRLAQLLEGYPRRLSSTAAIGKALDCLYREIRAGLVSSEMGRVLLSILIHIMDTQIKGSSPDPKERKRRSKVDRMRPKLEELLAQAEQAASRVAVANAFADKINEKAAPPDADHAEVSIPAGLPRNGRSQQPPRLVMSHASR